MHIRISKFTICIIGSHVGVKGHETWFIKILMVQKNMLCFKFGFWSVYIDGDIQIKIEKKIIGLFEVF